MGKAYIVNVLADEYDTQHQLLGSERRDTRKDLATWYERLQTERSAAGSRALEVSFKEASSAQQCCQLCQ